MSKQFKPTFLYVKEHSATGLKYFGKTTLSDPVKYKGSGSYWRNHITKHGIDKVITTWFRLFLEEKECVEFALAFSKKNNIVESSEWANQMIEDGLWGNGSPGRKASESTIEKHRKSATGKRFSVEVNAKKSLPGNKNGMYGIRRYGKDSPHFGKPHSEETKKILKIKAETREKLECPHCGKICDAANAKRHHFDNCIKSPLFDSMKHWEKKMIGRVCRLFDKKELDAGNWRKYMNKYLLGEK